MKTKSILLVALACAFVGCKDYMTQLAPGTNTLSDFFINGQSALQTVTACYTPLIWEYNRTYNSEWFIGDIASDDALKGGQNTTDMENAYDIENWKTTSNNDLVYDHYITPYQGIARCNLALEYVTPMALDSLMTQRMKNRMLGEVRFLRAYYYFHMVRLFGGVPLTLQVENTEENWELERSSVQVVFEQIIADLEYANKNLWLKSEYDITDMGRATKGAAQGMLQKVYLYMASPYWHDHYLQSLDRKQLYQQSKNWGDSLIQSGQYSLVPDYESNFTLAGENNSESVFELQYMEVPWGDYGDGNGGHNGYTAGSFTQILIRSRSSKIGGGWGFNHPTYNLYNEFEPADTIRRDVAIYVPDSSMMDNKVEETYCGDPMLNNKYAMYREKDDPKSGIGKWGYHQSRGPLNRAYMRYADNLLMYAEACLGLGDEAGAILKINEVRARVSLPAYPGYSFSVNGKSIASPTVQQALRHERRMELAMEAHRWFDLVRWSDESTGETIKKHIEAYQATESATARSHIAEFVQGKHELFPIPIMEMERNKKLTQNPGY